MHLLTPLSLLTLPLLTLAADPTFFSSVPSCAQDSVKRGITDEIKCGFTDSAADLDCMCKHAYDFAIWLKPQVLEHCPPETQVNPGTVWPVVIRPCEVLEAQKNSTTTVAP